MLNTDLFHIESQQPSNSKHIQQMTARAKEWEQRICPYCRSRNDVVVHKKNVSKKVHDMYNNEPTEIVFLRDRYRCNRCKKTFFAPQDEQIGQSESDEFKKVVAENLLSDLSASFSSVGKKYGLGKTTISNIFKDQFRKHQSVIVEVSNCNRLFLCPIEYEGIKRCLIIGCDWQTQINRLLWILDEYTLKAVRGFSTEKIHNQYCITEIFCAPDKDIVNFCKDYFREATVGIIGDCVDILVDSLKIDTLDGRFNEKCDALNRFECVIKKTNSSTFLKEYDSWWNSLTPELKISFGTLNASITDFPDEWANYSDYTKDELDCSKFIKTIMKLRQKNVPFEMMRYRIMFGIINKDRQVYIPDTTMSMVYFQNAAQAYGIKNYGVKLKDILAIKLK